MSTTLSANIINDFASNYNENVLNENCAFNREYSPDIISGVGVSNTSLDKAFNGTRSLFINNLSYTNPFRVGSTKWFTELSSYRSTQNSIFQFSVYNTSGIDISGKFYIYNNSIELYVINFTAPYTPTGWTTFFQSINLPINDFDFAIELNHNVTEYTECYIDGLKLEFDDKLQSIPTTYTYPVYEKLTWQSRVDTTNTQSLTANAENAFGFSGTSEASNNVELIATDGTIKAKNLKDTITIDYAFTLVTPSGTDRYIDVSFVVNSIAYRGTTHILLHGSGNNQRISGSWTLPIANADLVNLGGKIYLNPNSACNINTRYISVVEHSN